MYDVTVYFDGPDDIDNYMEFHNLSFDECLNLAIKIKDVPYFRGFDFSIHYDHVQSDGNL